MSHARCAGWCAVCAVQAYARVDPELDEDAMDVAERNATGNAQLLETVRQADETASVDRPLEKSSEKSRADKKSRAGDPRVKRSLIVEARPPPRVPADARQSPSLSRASTTSQSLRVPPGTPARPDAVESGDSPRVRRRTIAPSASSQSLSVHAPVSDSPAAALAAGLAGAALAAGLSGSSHSLRRVDEPTDSGRFGRGWLKLTLRHAATRTPPCLVVVVHKCVQLMPCDLEVRASPLPSPLPMHPLTHSKYFRIMYGHAHLPSSICNFSFALSRLLVSHFHNEAEPYERMFHCVLLLHCRNTRRMLTLH